MNRIVELMEESPEIRDAIISGFVLIRTQGKYLPDTEQ
jgi:hypothetical protein